MWTSTMELNPRRALLTRFLGQFWPGAYFSSFAPLQVQNLPRQTLPSQAHDWIRVRNRLAGISSSDLHFIYSDGDFRIAPAALPGRTHTYPGQEVVGEIIEVGEDVQHVKSRRSRSAAIRPELRLPGRAAALPGVRRRPV